MLRCQEIGHLHIKGRSIRPICKGLDDEGRLLPSQGGSPTACLAAFDYNLTASRAANRSCLVDGPPDLLSSRSLKDSPLDVVKDVAPPGSPIGDHLVAGEPDEVGGDT